MAKKAKAKNEEAQVLQQATILGRRVRGRRYAREAWPVQAQTQIRRKQKRGERAEGNQRHQATTPDLPQHPRMQTKEQ